jgi:16S rRNA (cytosine1402-N4)-methyltransferase
MHYSVLLQESIELLNIKPDGVYVDGTFGRGGHTQAILQLLGDNGRVLAFDKDPQAIEYAQQVIGDSRLTVVHASFATLGAYLQHQQIPAIDGVLLDLGVSSPQLDTPERGFSFRFSAPLDMRMDTTSGMTAAEWLNSASEAELAEVFWRYGEERFSRKIARAIVSARANEMLTTTSQLANLISATVPFKEKGQHPATRVFQAIRIYINNELADLEQILIDAPTWLALGGRMVVISFHSLEDRIVKNSFNQLASPPKLPKWVMTQDQPALFKVVAKKVRAGVNELSENSRSRSAIMRGVERIGVTHN